MRGFKGAAGPIGRRAVNCAANHERSRHRRRGGRPEIGHTHGCCKCPWPPRGAGHRGPQEPPNTPRVKSDPPLEPKPDIDPSDASAAPSGPRRADLALRTALVLVTPVVRWLLRRGVQYGALATALKRVFVKVAAEELERLGRRTTDSAVSVLSGVHRKDVRAFYQTGRAQQRDKSLSPASLVFTRWATDARWRHPSTGQPLRLSRLGPGLSFETLAREVSTDVHPRTLLDELLRLDLVRIVDDEVELAADSFVPSADEAAMAELFAANGADHLSAAVHNLTTDGPKLLEQSVFATGLSSASAEELGVLARRLWAEAFARMAEEASRRHQADQTAPAPHRMRFGVYYYTEAMTPERSESPLKKEASE